MRDVEDFYDRNPQIEWERLTRNRTEYAVTLRAFAHYIPPPPAAVLDIGGGPGRYAVALAGKGYQVTLVDISRKSLDFARSKAGKAGVTIIDFVHKSAIDLPFPPEKYDVCLLMGPLYHLKTEERRRRAVSEAVRVLKPGGLIFASFVTSYAPLRWSGKYDPSWVLHHKKQCEQILSSGAADPGLKESFVDYTWFAHPEEVNPLMETADIESLDLIACEGIISFIDEQVNQLTGHAWEVWVDMNFILGKDSTVLGAAEHLLYVGRKK